MTFYSISDKHEVARYINNFSLDLSKQNIYLYII